MVTAEPWTDVADLLPGMHDHGDRSVPVVTSGGALAALISRLVRS